MKMSRHAQVRCQQRRVPPLIVAWLLEYGAEERSGGATKRFFDHEARRRLSAAFGAEVVSRLAPLLNTYVVEGDDQLVTAGIRTRRIRRSR